MSSVVDVRTGRILAWKDGIPLHYAYTAGTAGEAFLRGLKEGRIIASKCGRCGEVRLPPRAYCLQCYGRTRVDVEMLHSGRIAALSTPNVGAGGAKVPTTPRVTFGFVTFEGVSGGLVHRILHERRSDPRLGDPVRPLFAPAERRKGSPLDLEGFRTKAKRGGNR
ncbi:MAG: Zn-ribbon domain-containing OB-fold protein [Nitrososphaerales archaeon]